MTNLPPESAIDAASQIAAGELRSEELVRDYLERIEARESDIQAWQYLDPEMAVQQARAADELRQTGVPVGPLHGVPVGIKDIIDTSDMPTERGSRLCAGRRPNEDASVVAQLRQAGAIIMGKTVSTEFACFAPNKTRNPRDPARTPGGSSSGSAAAVADGMIPLALGTQTVGSIIRPASFCGTVGYKPTHGMISRHGVFMLSRKLDHVGVFANSVADAAALADAIMNYDSRDPDMRPASRGGLLQVATAEPPMDPVLGFVKTPRWREAEDGTRAAFVELLEVLGENCDEVDLPSGFEAGFDWQSVVFRVDIARSISGYYKRGRHQLSDRLAELVEQGREMRAVEYLSALELREVLYAGLNEVFERYDAVLTPAAPGEAPVGLGSTGNPVFCALWTYLGVPAVVLPLLEGTAGMPIGVQLIGRRGDDGRLLRTANWLMERVRKA